MSDTLPITTALPELTLALRNHGRAVLQAPPGAGKTTTVPLHLLDHVQGKIVMLEPRRLAARHAAERMASLLGEKPGERVGYRMRGASVTSEQTRIEVVTEGVLNRMLQSDPELRGIGMVIFDEFHERSLNADLGLALCLEVAEALREDLQLLVMSATLDAEPVAALLDAPLVTSEGRSFPVDVHHLERPVDRKRWEPSLHDFVLHVATETAGGILVFLPGTAEIRRAEAALAGRLRKDTKILPLHGGLPFAEQRRATSPLAQGRKIVLATSIAETSLTLPDISVVVDAGRARRMRFDPGSGMSRLVTEPVSRAEALQRAGRAGRVGPGTCYRLWTKGEEGALPAFPPAEIETADLASFALELAAWGTGPDDLALLTKPNAGSYAEAQALLVQLGALDPNHRLTLHGKDLARMPVHPRLAHMLLCAGSQAAPLAALMSDRDPMPSEGADLQTRLKALRGKANAPALQTLRKEARRLEQHAPKTREALSDGEMAAFAYPDRIGLRRAGDAPRYLLSGGKGAYFRDGETLGQDRLIVATDLDGNGREARIRLAVPLSESALRAQFGDQIAWHNLCTWSNREDKVLARSQEKLGVLVLNDRIWKDALDADLTRAFLDGVRHMGLRFTPAAERLRARVALARKTHTELPDLSETALLDTVETWLAPFVQGLRSKADWRGFDITPALSAMLSWGQSQTLDHIAPAYVTTPLGRKVPVDYASVPPAITVRLQEMFGTRQHPTVAGQAIKVTLLSPAQRPVQTTTDLPGFWQSSYADVRKDMRGRYPKHPWPEDPTEATPTLRANPRKTE